MKYWLRGKRGGLIAFLMISTLVIGGLGWVTAAALQLEQDQLEARAQDQLNTKLREALWRLDSRIWPVLAKEDSRPYNDYSAVYTPPLALRPDTTVCQPGSMVLLSPLLNAALPDWMLLHFRLGEEVGWGSPQVLSGTLIQCLDNAHIKTPMPNVTPERKELLHELAKHLPPQTLLALVQERNRAEMALTDTTLVPTNNPDNNLTAPGQAYQQSASAVNNSQIRNQPNQPQGQNQMPPQTANAAGQNRTARNNAPNSQPNQQLLEQRINDSEYQNRYNVKSNSQKEVQNKAQQDDLDVVVGNTIRNGESWFSRNPVKPRGSKQTEVLVEPMVPLWLSVGDQDERLVVARLVRIDDKQVCQGILLDWPKLHKLLAEEVAELFPNAEFVPVREAEPPYPERTMTALPVQLEPGPADALAPLGWTPLRVGLALSWAAALVALLAVGLGGWSLIDLSERRIRFVSAVTHELRTPLTTLRLYLDMLTGGIIKEEQQRTEYLQTLNSETDRLHRLVGNVLDFSRLENQRPRLEKTHVTLGDLLDQVHSTWQGRCQQVEKELVIEDSLGDDVLLFTDVKLVQQILGNLIDNACKYSQGAEDCHIWVRAHKDGRKRLVLEVEDRGPGVTPRDGRSIFQPFRRGRDAEVTAGGVGLGLALARRWARLLGGRLTLSRCAEKNGACFRLELPLS